MRSKIHSASGKAVTALIIEVFRFNGRLLMTGDQLMTKLGLTSARWQVLGAIAIGPNAEPVARLARNMGLNRQGVQRIVSELAEEGYVRFDDNPHHKRARLVRLTAKGRAAYEAAERLQKPWANELAKGLDAKSIGGASAIIETLRMRLEGQAGRLPRR
jgi:DNA-binding MarR family transcriptional regulator